MKQAFSLQFAGDVTPRGGAPGWYDADLRSAKARRSTERFEVVTFPPCIRHVREPEFRRFTRMVVADVSSGLSCFGAGRVRSRSSCVVDHMVTECGSGSGWAGVQMARTDVHVYVFSAAKCANRTKKCKYLGNSLDTLLESTVLSALRFSYKPKPCIAAFKSGCFWPVN
jgi:hypothetical protein